MLRANVYNRIVNAPNNRDLNIAQLSYQVILLSLYIRGDCFIAQCYQDLIAVLQALRNLDLFIIVIANLSQLEITRELLLGQIANNRLDIISCVFKLKSKAILIELKASIFREYARIVQTIKFQKQGLPYQHIILFLSLRARHRYRNLDNVDQCVSIELPTAEANLTRELQANIAQQIVYRPYSLDKPLVACTQDSNARAFIDLRYSKKFLKAFQEEIVLLDNSYPLYQRRDNSKHVIIKVASGQDIQLNNQHIIPYNLYLSRRYNAYINIKICSGIKAIKYIYKYIYKGTN